MTQYFNYLFNKLKLSHQKLEDLSTLKGKTWARINTEEEEKWFFQDNGKLTVSVNGNITEGQYQILNEFLLIGHKGNKILTQKNYIYKDILLLQKDSDNSDFLLFYNSSKYTFNELLQVIQNERKKDLNILNIKLVGGEIIEVIKDYKGEEPLLGDQVLSNGSLIDKTQIETEGRIFILKESKISEIYYKKNYIVYSNNITIKQKRKTPAIGDQIIYQSNPDISNLIKLNFNKGILIKNNIIERIFKIDYIETIYYKNKLQIWRKSKQKYLNGDMIFLDNKKAPDGKYWVSFFTIINCVNGKISS
jgi:hypothetical protein